MAPLLERKRKSFINCLIWGVLSGALCMCFIICSSSVIRPSAIIETNNTNTVVAETIAKKRQNLIAIKTTLEPIFPSLDGQALVNDDHLVNDDDLQLAHMPPVTYERCMASLEGKNQSKKYPRIHWIHVPKAGSSLSTAIYTYLCQEKDPHYKFTRVLPVRNCSNHCGGYSPKAWDGYASKLLPVKEFKYCDPDVSYAGSLQSHMTLPPLPLSIALEDYGAVPFGLFRDPRRRIVSALNDNKHTFGTRSYSREYLVQQTPTLMSFAHHRAVQSCQVKMLLGQYCGDINYVVR